MTTTIRHRRNRALQDRYEIDVTNGGDHRYAYLWDLTADEAIDNLAAFGFGVVSARGMLEIARTDGTVDA